MRLDQPSASWSGLRAVRAWRSPARAVGRWFRVAICCGTVTPLFAPGEAVSTPWGSIAAGTNDGLQAAALVLGGTIGYLRYIRGRLLHASLVLTVEADLVEIAGRDALSVTTGISNAGTLRMGFRPNGEERVTVYCLSEQQWQAEPDGAAEQWTTAAPSVTWDQLIDNDGFKDLTIDYEPGDAVKTTRLVALPPGNWVAYKICFHVDSAARMIARSQRPYRWDTSTLLIRRPDEPHLDTR